MEWLPYFANFRRDGYDFDARWEDGLANRREKKIMDLLTDIDEDGDIVWKDEQILSTDLKKTAGFGKGRKRSGGSLLCADRNESGEGEKNYPGIVTGLQMQTYLVITDFHRRVNKRGQEYGMPVSVMLPPEAVWGYDTVTSAYSEKPAESWQRIYDRVRGLYPDSEEKEIIRLIGKMPK